MRVKHAFLYTAAAVLLLCGTLSPLFAAEGVFRDVSGKVEYRNPGESWRRAAVGQRVPAGAQISTGFNSEASIELESSILTVKALTRMTIEELVEKEGLVSTDLHLKVGRVRAEVKSSEGLRHNFRVSSPVSTASVKGTSFEFDGVNIVVFGGTVRFTNQNNIGGNVSAGGRGSATGQGAPRIGAAAREGDMRVLFSTLPDFSNIDGLLVPIDSYAGLTGIEYGSIGGTVTFN